MKIGIVSEGIHDFLVLKEAIETIGRRRSKPISSVESLQPIVDATSQRQRGAGGWARVRVWLEDNAGDQLHKVLSPQLFSTSPHYDILVVHLDGDVIWLCNEFTQLERAQCFNQTSKVVQTIEKFIEQKLDIPDDLDDRIVYAVPALHTESWLICAAKRAPFRTNIEHRKIKLPAQRYLSYRYKIDDKQLFVKAARDLGVGLDELRKELVSLDHFCKKLETLERFPLILDHIRMS